MECDCCREQKCEICLLEPDSRQCFMSLNYLFMFNPYYWDGAECYSGCLTPDPVSMKQRGRRCGAGQREMFLTFYSHDWHQHVGQTRAEEQHSSFFHLCRAARCQCERQRNCVARGPNVFLFNRNLFSWLSLFFPWLWKKVIYALEYFLSFGVFATHAYVPFVYIKMQFEQAKMQLFNNAIY